MLSVYLSAAYSEKNRVKQFALRLHNFGIKVTSTWMDESYEPDVKMSDVPESFLKETACNDCSEMDEAEIMVLFSVPCTTLTVRGGKHFETGYMVHSGKEVYVIGPKENIFHHLSNMTHFENEDLCFEALCRRRMRSLRLKDMLN
jgi:hypothetical protein